MSKLLVDCSCDMLMVLLKQHLQHFEYLTENRHLQVIVVTWLSALSARRFSWSRLARYLEIYSFAPCRFSLVSCEIALHHYIASRSQSRLNVELVPYPWLFASATKISAVVFVLCSKLVVVSVCMWGKKAFWQPHPQALPWHSVAGNRFCPASFPMLERILTILYSTLSLLKCIRSPSSFSFGSLITSLQTFTPIRQPSTNTQGKWACCLQIITWGTGLSAFGRSQ